jgi:hypothetical protein
VNVKTRKRNIVVPSDPGSFADAIVQVFQDAAEEGAPLDKNLEAGVKVCAAVVALGGEGGGVVLGGGGRVSWCVLCLAHPPAITPFLKTASHLQQQKQNQTKTGPRLGRPRLFALRRHALRGALRRRPLVDGRQPRRRREGEARHQCERGPRHPSLIVLFVRTRKSTNKTNKLITPQQTKPNQIK